MRRFLSILVLVCAAASHARTPQNAAPPASSEVTPQTSATPAAAQSAIPVDQENARKAKALIDQAIQALGGEAYLTIRDRALTGRTFGFHHGRSSGNGIEFWSFSEFPDKERVELTKQRDITELYVGAKAWEITYKGPKPIEPKDLDDYMRRRRFSLETILRTWVTDPSVAMLYEGNVNAAQHPALQVTLINAKNEAVTLDFDIDTHLPVRKSFEWRDPVDRQKNLEEEIYENYRLVQGVMTPYNVTGYFNGDMSRERFIFSATYNTGLDQAMFDPNSGYDPNKQAGKQSKKR
jgi:hypothetical protein